MHEVCAHALEDVKSYNPSTESQHFGAETEVESSHRYLSQNYVEEGASALHAYATALPYIY